MVVKPHTSMYMYLFIHVFEIFILKAYFLSLKFWNVSLKYWNFILHTVYWIPVFVVLHVFSNCVPVFQSDAMSAAKSEEQRKKQDLQQTLANLGNALEIELDGEPLSYDESLEQGPIDGMCK